MKREVVFVLILTGLASGCASTRKMGTPGSPELRNYIGESLIWDGMVNLRDKGGLSLTDWPLTYRLLLVPQDFPNSTSAQLIYCDPITIIIRTGITHQDVAKKLKDEIDRMWTSGECYKHRPDRDEGKLSFNARNNYRIAVHLLKGGDQPSFQGGGQVSANYEYVTGSKSGNLQVKSSD